MTRTLKIIVGLAACICVVAVGLFGLTFVDVNRFKGEIEEAVHEATGRSLTLEGSLRIAYSLRPTIIAENVSFGNASWGSQAVMMSASELSMSLSIPDLLMGEFELADVAASDVSLFLESHRNGRVNWDIRIMREAGAEVEMSPAAPEEDPFVLPSLSLDGARISYLVGRTGQRLEARLDRIRLENDFGGLQLELAGKLDDQSLLVSGRLEGAPSDFRIDDFEVQLAEMRFSGNLSAKRSQAGGPYNLVADIQSSRVDVTSIVEDLLSDAGAESESNERIDLSFLDLVDGDVRLAVDRVDFRDASLSDISIRLKSEKRAGQGNLTAMYDGKRVSLDIDLQGSAVPQIALKANVEDMNIGSLVSEIGVSDDIVATAKGQVELTSKGGTFDELVAALTGKVDGELILDRIDLTRMGEENGEDGDDAETASAAESDGAVFLFDRDPLPLDMIDGFQGKLLISATEIIYNDLVISALEIPITFEGRSVSAELKAVYKEREIRFSQKAWLEGLPAFEFDLTADDFDLGLLLKETGATDLVDVRADLAIHGTSQGQTARALASSFTGGVNLVAGEGQIASGLVELIAADLVFALVPKGADARSAKLKCVVSALAFENGKGTVSSFALVTERMRTGGKGSIDLNDERLDLTFVPKPNDVSLLSLSTPIRVTGTLLEPTVFPDTGALLLDVATAVGAGVLTGGIGAILPLLSVQKFDAEDADACLSMLSSGEALGERGGLIGTVSEGAGAVTDGAVGVVEGIGDVLTSPFE